MKRLIVVTIFVILGSLLTVGTGFALSNGSTGFEGEELTCGDGSQLGAVPPQFLSLVDFTEGPPAIQVIKTADPTSLPEPGGEVTFAVEITNNSSPTDPVNITKLVDDVHGDLNGQGTCSVPQNIQPGGSYTCEFTALVEGNAGYTETDTVTATGADNECTPVRDSDDATVTITDVLPAIDVLKTADPTQVTEPGGEVTFTVVVTNMSLVDELTITTLVDDIHGNLDGQGTCSVPQTLAVGESYTCAFTALVEGDAGDSETDTVTATGHDDEGNTVHDSDDATVEIVDGGDQPVIEVVKTADPTVVVEPGGMVTFTVVVNNDSEPGDPVTINELVDDIHGDLNGQGTCSVPQTIQPGGSYTCTFPAMVEGVAGDSETDTVTASGEDDEGTPVEDSDDATVEIVAVGEPVIDVTKTADPTMLIEPGGPVDFTYVVENTGAVSVTITSLSDDVFGTLAGDADCQVGTFLGIGDSCEFTITRMVEGEFGGPDHVNVFTAVAEDEDGNEATDDDDATVEFLAEGTPIIEVVKTADPTVVFEPGGEVTFTVVVNNDSGPDDPVTITELVDDIHGDLNGQGTCSVPQTIPPGGSYTCQFTAMVEGDAGDSETDTVTARGEDDEGTPVEDSDDATVEIVAVDTPVINVVKTADPTVLIEPGGMVTFTVTIENNSGQDDPVTITELVDDIHGDLDGQGTCSVPQTILPGDSYTCQFAAMVEGAGGYNEIDVVTARGTDDEGTPVEDSDDATVKIVPVDTPVINVIKTADPEVLEEPGGVVTFTVTVTNNSGPDDPVIITSLFDSIHGDLNGQGTCSVPQVLQPGDSYTCEFSAPVEGSAGDTETDVVTASGHDDEGTPVEDSDDAEVRIVHADGIPVIDVVKDANPTNLPVPGGVVTFTVTVTNNSGQDDPVTITSLVDDIHGDLNGQGTCSVPQTLQPGESYTCQFTALVEGETGDTETDTVTARGRDDDGYPVEDSDDATVRIGLYLVYLPGAENERVIYSLVPLTLGYEDLDIERDDMDYDYNDWVTTIEAELQVDEVSQDLYRIIFTFVPQARGGVRTHTPHIMIPANSFDSDGVATLKVYDGAGNLISSEQTVFIASQDNDFAVLDCTCDAFPKAGQVINAFEEQPYEPTNRTSQLTIQFFDHGPFNMDYLSPEQISIPHGEGLFFDPYLVVHDRDLEIHQGDPRLLSVPDINFAWPEERVRLDEVYPLVDGTPPNFIFADQWWTQHNTCVYGDGIKCPLSPDMNSYIPE